MFTFTWARLGMFLAILLGVPLFIFLAIKFIDWAEKNITREMASWCFIAVVIILLGIFAGYIAFFN